MEKILSAEHIPLEALAGLGGRVQLLYPDQRQGSWNAAEVAARQAGCSVFLAEAWPVDREFLSSWPGLRVVANFGVGYDKIDVEAATELGIAVINTPRSVTHPTAELAISLMLSLLRDIPGFSAELRRSLTVKAPMFPRRAHSAAGKTLGIIGFGRIGREVARMARALGMNIIYSDPQPAPAEVEAELMARRLPLEQLLAAADVVTLHCFYSPDNYHLLNAERLALLKPEAYLINCSRGPVVEEAALLKALKSNALAGAALDVFEFEPQVSREMLKTPRLLLTPHIGTSTFEDYCRMFEEAISGVLAVLAGEVPYNMLNPQLLAPIG